MNKSEMGKVAVGFLTIARDAVSDLSWILNLDDGYQEWKAEAPCATLVQLFAIYRALSISLKSDGWKESCDSADSVDWCKGPLSTFSHAHEFDLSLGFDSEGISIRIDSDIGKASAYDHPDQDDPSKWISSREWRDKARARGDQPDIPEG